MSTVTASITVEVDDRLDYADAVTSVEDAVRRAFTGGGMWLEEYRHTAPAIVTEDLGVKVTITESAGTDGAIVVFIDTEFEPSAVDGGPGLRVLINDHDTYAGVPWAPAEDED